LKQGLIQAKSLNKKALQDVPASFEDHKPGEEHADGISRCKTRNSPVERHGKEKSDEIDQDLFAEIATHGHPFLSGGLVWLMESRQNRSPAGTT
jgi:hypothetical protein